MSESLNAHHFTAAPVNFRPQVFSPPQELSIRVLRTQAERKVIERLRRYADSASEYELNPGMADLESAKDRLGLVMAMSYRHQTIATIRFIPVGFGLTFTERFWHGRISDPRILGAASWEVGRLVMAPEHRQSDLLPRCMAMALTELRRHVPVQHFHASCHPRMTRLYRRFGFTTHCEFHEDAMDSALIQGCVEQVARALKISPSAPMTVLQ